MVLRQVLVAQAIAARIERPPEQRYPGPPVTKPCRLGTAATASLMRAVSSSVDTPPGATSRSLSEVDAAEELSDEHAASHRPAPASKSSSRRFMGAESQIEPRRLSTAPMALYRNQMTNR